MIIITNKNQLDAAIAHRCIIHTPSKGLAHLLRRTTNSLTSLIHIIDNPGLKFSGYATPEPYKDNDLAFYMDDGEIYEYCFIDFYLKSSRYNDLPFYQLNYAKLDGEYKVGDIVKVRDDLRSNTRYDSGCCCLPHMAKNFSGQSVIISGVTHSNDLYNSEEGEVRYRIDGDSYSWSPSMFDNVLCVGDSQIAYTEDIV